MNNLRALNVLTILSNYINNLFNELIPTYLQEPIKDYDDYLTKIINCANETLKISTESKAKEITLIKENLKKEGLTIKDTIIIRNIVLNYLSNYLHQEKEKIINLNPSTLKKVKYYGKSLSNHRTKENDRQQCRSLQASHQARVRPQPQDQEVLVRG